MTLTQQNTNQAGSPAPVLFTQVQGLLDQRRRRLQSGSTTMGVRRRDRLGTFRTKTLQQAPNSSHGQSQGTSNGQSILALPGTPHNRLTHRHWNEPSHGAILANKRKETEPGGCSILLAAANQLRGQTFVSQLTAKLLCRN
jgi:hypothetical protein